MSDRRHKFRCSQLPQLMRCYGSALLLTRVRSTYSTQVAAIGSWCHYAGARILIDTHGAVGPDDFVGPKMPPGWQPSGFHRWMVEFWVQAVLDFVHVDMALLVEEHFEHAFPNFDLSGHMDVVGITADETEAVVMDLKTGADKVDDAEDNSQILGYIVLLKLAFPKLQKVTAAIVQPMNNPKEGVERITLVTVEGDKLDGCVSYLERELNHAIEHELELNSDGYKQCRYCPAGNQLQCPCINAEIEHMKLTLTDEHLAAIAQEPSGEKLLEIVFAKKKLEPIFKSADEALRAKVAEAAGKRMQIAGRDVWLEVHPMGTEFTDNKAATEALSDLPDDLFHTTYEFAKDPIVKALAKHATATTGQKVPQESKDPKKLSGKKLFQERFAGITTQKTCEWLRIGN